MHASWRILYASHTPPGTQIPDALRVERPWSLRTAPVVPRTQAEIVTEIRKFREARGVRADG